MNRQRVDLHCSIQRYMLCDCYYLYLSEAILKFCERKSLQSIAFLPMIIFIIPWWHFVKKPVSLNFVHKLRKQTNKITDFFQANMVCPSLDANHNKYVTILDIKSHLYIQIKLFWKPQCFIKLLLVKQSGQSIENKETFYTSKLSYWSLLRTESIPHSTLKNPVSLF